MVLVSPTASFSVPRVAEAGPQYLSLVWYAAPATRDDGGWSMPATGPSLSLCHIRPSSAPLLSQVKPWKTSQSK